MNIVTAISLLILVLYVLKIRNYKNNWERYPEYTFTESIDAATITVIIAFRNEIANLDALLTSLFSQTYPADLYEVILVNDHSGDGSDELVQRFCDKHQNFRLLHNDSRERGKKAAIMKGVYNASYDLIVTTDADCTMHEHWLVSFAQAYQEEDADMVVGLVDMVPGSSFFGRFQELEFLSLVAAGAGAVAGRHPIYCNGACLSYRKSAFLAIADPMRQKIISGEDTLFLHELKRNPENSIALLKAVPAIVVTRGNSTLGEFVQQHKRWVSKSPYYRDPDTLITALLVLLVNLSSLYALTLLVTGRNCWFYPVMYGVKMLTDLIFLKSFLRFYGKNLPVWWFMLYELMYPFYAVFFAIAGICSGFTWKGRRFEPNSPIPT
jgi:poly-beta-1,6-N-acetyl-D-glucosamine synthase